MKLILLFFLSLCSFVGFNQNEFAFHWFSNEETHIDWSNQSPAFLFVADYYGFEGNVTYSDENGNLLFYSNQGDVNTITGYSKIWNRNGDVMPSGDIQNGLGCLSSRAGGVVIPDFTNPDVYHIFTTDCAERLTFNPPLYKGLSRSTVDMSLDNGNGDLVNVDVHIFGDTITPLGENLRITHDNTGEGYWLITHGIHFTNDPIPNDTFYVFHYDTSGISGPIKQPLGNVYSGHLEIAPDGRHLSFGNEIYLFDKVTGILTLIDSITGIEVFHSSFSPDGQLFYAHDGHTLCQWEVNAADINATQVILHQFPTNEDFQFTQLQITPNCQILVVYDTEPYIGKILYANNLGSSCGFVKDEVYYPPLRSIETVPNFVESLFQCADASLAEENEPKIKAYYLAENHSIQVQYPELKNETSFQVFDLSGRMVQSGQIVSTQDEIALQKMTQGIYILKIKGWSSQLKFAVIK